MPPGCEFSRVAQCPDTQPTDGWRQRWGAQPLRIGVRDVVLTRLALDTDDHVTARIVERGCIVHREPGLVDLVDLQSVAKIAQWILTGHFDPDKFRDDPPADIVEETVTITFPKATGDTSAATAAATCFITDVDISASLGTIQMMTLTLKITGNVTLTAAT